ncbi:hypothetical protein jhhlp_001360 [Lomentospora prolificans]|uniref:Uncharacterized protein n=1 Tax=Lomentospora prolificans TaxID=41688 RepID=A0A2N3NI14_9PEZI|nr:hypothetical protein jhhlp_001360 [Lomentospora prolificans]
MEQAQSYPPCHLFGDSDLYGLGIRLGFYLQYLAAIVALSSGYTNGLKSLRTGLTILSLSLFVTLCTTSTGNGLVILDWYLVMALTGQYIFLSDLFVRVAAAKVYCLTRFSAPLNLKRHRKSEMSGRRETRVSVADLMRTDVAETVKPRQSTLIEAGLAVYRTHYNLSDIPEKPDPADEDRTAFRHALIDFGRAARDSPEVAARYSIDKIARTNAPGATTSEEKRGSEFDKRQFKSDFVQAARGTGMTNTEAEHLGRRIAAEIKKEAADERSRATLAEIREALYAVRPRDMLAVGVICISWAAYQFVRPWLYWRGLRRGLKAGCDVKLMWFFVPASIYNEAFALWLRIWGIFMFVCGVLYFAYGSYVIATNMFAARRWFSRKCLAADVESQRRLLGGSVSPPHDEAPTLSMTSQRTQVTEPRQGKQATKRCHVYFRIIAAFQAVILAVSAVVVEGTIRVNRLDMNRGSFRTSSQLMAFVVGVISSVPVFWECLIIAPLKLVMSKRKKREPPPATWYGRPTRIESSSTVHDIPRTNPSPVPPVPPVPHVRMTSANVI